MRRLEPPQPDNIRNIQQTRPFVWFDPRISWFWGNMTKHELLLYYFLVTQGDINTGCSYYSSREITRILKIGPSSLIEARKRLVKRKLIAISKDELSNRTIYQVLPLPIDENARIEIPMLVDVDDEPAPASKKALLPEPSADERLKSNQRNISMIKELLEK